ncbi:class I SAM-dependent methyltransferase [Cyanobacterium sp. Dongsha4]|uniref:class I SAM-dependent methyltransferase n=1 Tax=Cyanobacterium sp. DS4 TaxID=2878255 RepID=UPI002E802E5C|nr:class I SAM-dependent methyltransferase [Cyanobacterium sp. Dongsha4]WVK99012.1 class I SAM-dependent methyltransferase [Cyanobacterium sp. Dongsha4]
MQEEIFIRQKRIFFDVWARFYDFTFTTIFYQAIHTRLLDYINLPSSPLILDLGCGTGKLLNRLAEEFSDLKGIGADLSPEMLTNARLANTHHPRLIFVRADAHDLPFADNQFDAVFNTISFLHYLQPEKVFREVARVLKKGGYFYLADYLGNNQMKKVFFTPGGIRFYNKAQRQKLASQAGLITVTHQYILSGVVLTIFQCP